MKNVILSVGLAVLLSSACFRAPRPIPPGNAWRPGLAGTAWQLVEIRSADAATQSARPEGNARYTVSFGKDGRVSMLLNCNRANGPWSVPGEGQLTIGPLAVTRALCPPPSLDARIARDMGLVRSYQLQDGRLYMNLMADGGVYVWQFAP